MRETSGTPCAVDGSCGPRNRSSMIKALSAFESIDTGYANGDGLLEEEESGGQTARSGKGVIRGKEITSGALYHCSYHTGTVSASLTWSEYNTDPPANRSRCHGRRFCET